MKYLMFNGTIYVINGLTRINFDNTDNGYNAARNTLTVDTKLKDIILDFLCSDVVFLELSGLDVFSFDTLCNEYEDSIQELGELTYIHHIDDTHKHKIYYESDVV